MKKVFYFLMSLTFLMTGITSCYDDAPLKEEIDSLKSKVASLEQLTSQMNTNISALQTAVAALQNNDYVTSIAEVKEGDKVIGYTLTFAKSGNVTIYHGKDGHSPVIGVKMFDDGLYYWTINDKWVTNNSGQNIKAEGLDAIAPKLKIENGRWLLSIDDGKTWTDAGQATGDKGDSFFNSVTQDEENVYLDLANGTKIVLPKSKPLSITFDESADISITAAATKTLNYTITGATNTTIVKAMGQNGWSVKVTPSNNESGTITITAPDPLVEDEVLVWVYDGEIKTIMSSLNFVTGVITVATNAFSLSKEASTQTVTVNTNIDYVVDIPTEAKSWISVASTRSAMRTETLTFSLSYNSGLTRYAIIYLKNNTGKVLQSIAFEQEGGTTVYVNSPGTLSDLIDSTQKNTIKVISVKGTLNNYDLLFLQEMGALTQIDMSGVTNTELLNGFFRDFSNSQNITNVILPSKLSKIPDYAFYACNSLYNVNIPESVSSIGQEAFYNCQNLTSVTLPNNLIEIGYASFLRCTNLRNISLPSSLKIIGNAAFEMCSNLNSINLPSGLLSIGIGAFAETGITAIEIPDKISKIEQSTFVRCSSLISVILHEGLISIGPNAFALCSSLKSIDLPNSVTEIMAWAFQSSGIETLTLGSGISTISPVAFYGTTKLNYVYCRATTPPIIDSSTFTTWKYLYIPIGTISLYKAAPFWSTFAVIEEKEF